MPTFIEVSFYTKKDLKCLLNVDKITSIAANPRGGCTVIYDPDNKDSYIWVAESYDQLKRRILDLCEIDLEFEEVKRDDQRRSYKSFTK